MIRLSIYNEKGGVGKTTITALAAGYLCYAMGKRVCVLDFDHPSYHISEMRLTELRILTRPKSPLSTWLRSNPSAAKPYNIIRVPTDDAGGYRPQDVFPLVANTVASGYDYIFYDFPGRFTHSEPVSYLAANGMIDRVFIPMDTDLQSRQSALVVADAMKRQGIPSALFWNRVTAYEAKGDGARFERGAEPFRSRGMDVMAEMVRDNKKLSRDSSEMAFLRSTLCFPERYIAHWNPSILPFLEALVKRTEPLAP